MKNLVIILTEIAVIFLMVFNVWPREGALFLTGLLIFYFIFSPLEDSLWVFIASIPLFAALPLTENFDSMANWRILLTVLFLVWLWESRKSITQLMRDTECPILKCGTPSVPYGPRIPTLAILSGIFLGLGVLSLINAADIIVGLKRLLYFINIFMLFLIVAETVKNKNNLLKIFQAMGAALGLTLLIGYLQFFSVFFTPLYTFWQFWAKNMIPVFYGEKLGNLLSYSNTWFSYYVSQPPTLRMFSVFPDSHSFALFLIIGLPLLLTAVFLRLSPFWLFSLKKCGNLPVGQAGPPNQRTGVENKRPLFFWYPLLIFFLLALIFSGSRGIWVSAFGLLIFLLISIIILRPSKATEATFRKFGSGAELFDRLRRFAIIEIGFPASFKLRPEGIKISQLVAGSLVIFFFLFPISSWFLFLSQKAQMDDLDLSKDAFLVFERAKSIADLSEVSVRGRLEIWQRTIDSIAARPVLGVGLANYPIVLNEDISAGKRGASAHNLYLDVAAEAGIFALLILLVIFWEILKTAWQVFGSQAPIGSLAPKYWAGFFGLVFIWILVYSLFDIVLLNDKVLLFFTVNLALLYAFQSPFNFRKSSDL